MGKNKRNKKEMKEEQKLKDTETLDPKVQTNAEEELHTESENTDPKSETPLEDNEIKVEIKTSEPEEDSIDPKDEIADLKDQLIRLQAEFQNFKKRRDKEATDRIRFAKEDLLKLLLPILDDFDRTLDAIDKTDNLTAVKEGIALVSNNMKLILSRIGLEPIESKGQPFDSEVHEAITRIPVEEEEKKDTVVEEIEKGYRLKDRVIRFAKVVIGA